MYPLTTLGKRARTPKRPAEAYLPDSRGQYVVGLTDKQRPADYMAHVLAIKHDIGTHKLKTIGACKDALAARLSA